LDEPVENDWHGEWELWSKCWLPCWCLDGIEDWSKDVFINPLEDCNADFIKWSPDQSHKVVPGPHDPVWDESNDCPDPVDDWPEEFEKEVEHIPEDAPEEVMDHDEELEDDTPD